MSVSQPKRVVVVGGVFVNGVHVLKWGEHTGALPGRVVRGPGWTGWSDDNEEL
jgi:N-acyl-D-amino-acid deacylase